MVEHPEHPQTEQYGETVDPHNPPNAVFNRDVRRGAWWLYVFPLIVVCVVAGIALLYWMTNDGTPSDDAREPIGTAGEELRQDGGGDPASRPGGTSEEVDRRTR
jgi:hypothetical protein